MICDICKKEYKEGWREAGKYYCLSCYEKIFGNYEESLAVYNADAIELMTMMANSNKKIDCIISDVPYKCFDKETKINTISGFKYFKDLTENDLILSLNLDNNHLEYSKIKKIIKYKTNENLLHFKSKNVDLMVTKNHRMVALRENWKQRNIYDLILENNDLIEAKDTLSSYYMLRSGFKFYGNNIDFFTIKELKAKPKSCYGDYPEQNIPIADWLRFFGFCLANGYTRDSLKQPKKNEYKVCIKQHIDNEEYVRNLLKALPYSFKENKENDKINFQINNKQLWLYLSQFGNSYTKFIPQWIKSLNPRLLAIFYNSYKLGDLTKGKNSVRIISSVSNQLIEDLWEIELKLGFMANIRNGKDNLFAFNISQKTMKKHKYPKYKEVEYDDFVYCVELEKNWIMFVNRNGRCAITGNCTERGCSGNSGGMLQKEINKKGKVFEHNSCDVKTYAPLMYKILKESGHCYIMTNHKNLQNFLNVFTENGFHFIKSLIWDKGNKIMGQYYMSQFEYILFFRKGRGVKINECGTPDILSVPNIKTKIDGKNIHDTEKPVELMEILVRNSTKENELVLDPFCGVGSTGIACKNLNRKFIGVEIDNNYAEIALNRLNRNLTF